MGQSHIDGVLHAANQALDGELSHTADQNHQQWKEREDGVIGELCTLGAEAVLVVADEGATDEIPGSQAPQFPHREKADFAQIKLFGFVHVYLICSITMAYGNANL